MRVTVQPRALSAVAKASMSADSAPLVDSVAISHSASATTSVVSAGKSVVGTVEQSAVGC
jgi:hypothetical protein